MIILENEKYLKILAAGNHTVTMDISDGKKNCPESWQRRNCLHGPQKVWHGNGCSGAQPWVLTSQVLPYSSRWLQLLLAAGPGHSRAIQPVRWVMSPCLLAYPRVPAWPHLLAVVALAAQLRQLPAATAITLLPADNAYQLEYFHRWAVTGMHSLACTHLQPPSAASPTLTCVMTSLPTNCWLVHAGITAASLPPHFCQYPPSKCFCLWTGNTSSSSTAGT